MIIDVSHHQGVIDWARTALAIDGAYIKVTEGAGITDDRWRVNHDAASGAGEPVGAYHFADLGDPVAEANHFADQYLTAAWQLRPVLDIETAGATAAWLAAFRRQFRARTGNAPFRVYSSLSLLTGALAPAGWIDADTDIWAARYASSLGWNHPQLVLWQNTSAATVLGILGSVDADQYCNGWTPAADLPPIGEPVLSNIDCPKGTNAHRCFGVAGAKGLRVHLGFGERVAVHQIVWVDDTNNQIPGGTYAPGGFGSDATSWVFESDRPGPVPVPPGATQCSLRYDAAGDFVVSVSS
jgi:hypothetical protein